MRPGTWVILVVSAIALTAIGGLSVGYWVWLNRAPAASPSPSAPSAWTSAKTAETGWADGEAEARSDAKAGLLGCFTTSGSLGYPPSRSSPHVVTMSDILSRDFGIRIKNVDLGEGCMLPPDAEYYEAKRQAYNETMTPFIEAKHGADVFSIARARANTETDAARESSETRRTEEIKDKPKNGCNPPYSIDRNGLKRVKPGCM